MPPWLPPLCLVLEKKYTIWYFGFSRSPRNKFARQYVKRELFQFARKFLPLLIMYLFLEIFLPQPPVMFSIDFN